MKQSRIGVIGLLLGLSWFLAADAADDAGPLRGEWRLSNWTLGTSVRLELSHRDANTRWQWSDDQPIEDLHGLTREQLHAVRTTVEFTLERDAGVLFFEGSLTVGVGRGTYRFVPSASFVSKLEALGYDAIEGKGISLLLMAVRDVSLAYAGAVKRLGLREVTVRDLVRFLDHGIDLGFIRGLVAAGLPGLSGDDVVRLRDHGIDPGFIKGLVEAGRSNVSIDDVIKLHDHGVNAQYVARVQSAGFKDLTVEQIVRLHDHGVD